jgi:hypothetical protein
MSWMERIKKRKGAVRDGKRKTSLRIRLRNDGKLIGEHERKDCRLRERVRVLSKDCD